MSSSSKNTRVRKAAFTAMGSLSLATALTIAALLAPIPSIAQDTLPPVTSVSRNPRLPGKFVWADLVTDDVAAARQFYFELFHWKFEEIGNYAIAFNNDRPLCGIFHRARPEGHPEAKPRWFGYISVPNVQRAQRAVTDGGGRVLMEAKKVPKRGDQAVFADAEGAIFGVIKSSSGDPEDFLASEGDWIWIQLLSHDAKKASAFYRTVAGYDVIENTVTNRLSDYVLTSKGYARATVRTIPGADVNVKPSWLPFVRVADVKQAAKKTEELGGKVLIPPRSELLDGKVAVIADPTGAAIGIMEWHEGMLKGGR